VNAERVIAPSVRKRGVSDEDILHVYADPIRIFELDDGLAMLIGANAAAVFYEVGVADGPTAAVVVHPCAPARSS